MRRKYLSVFICAALTLVPFPSDAEAQRRHGPPRGPVIVRSPLLFTSYYHAPYHFGLGQWYPYPVFGLPPGFFLGDHFSSLRLQIPQRDALVFVDGYAAGIVDDYDGVFQRLQLVPGHHEIVVYLQGYRTLRQNLYFNPGSTHTIRDTLTPLAPGEAPEPQPVPRVMPPLPGSSVPPLPGPNMAATGTLALRVQPRDATIYIDGEIWRAPQGQDRLVIQLGEGSHNVRIEKSGLQSFGVDIDVRAGETTALNVTLH